MLTDKDLDNIKKKDSRDRIFIIFCYSTSYLVMLLAPLVMLLAPPDMLLLWATVGAAKPTVVTIPTANTAITILAAMLAYLMLLFIKSSMYLFYINVVNDKGIFEI